MTKNEITDALALFTDYMDAYGWSVDTPGFKRSRRFWMKYLKRVTLKKRYKKKKKKDDEKIN